MLPAKKYASTRFSGLGEEVWKTGLGNSGGELGVRGWLTALDAGTGESRAYSTGPDSDVLIGEDFQPFYPQDREPDLGVKTGRMGR